MNIEEFADCLDRWGSDFEQWPALQKDSARNLLATSKRAGAKRAGARRAAEMLAEARRLDDLLTNLQANAAEHRAPMGLQRSILEQLPPHDPLQNALDWFSAALWRPALAAACTLLLGFALGVSAPLATDDAMLNDVSMLAFSTTYEELSDADQ
ncbi:MAG: hypothetical protein OES38_12940 [Gammaproteobacteria bacterium]|nr:hypothetical protein [Gammaproteobacteria bacterium]